MILKFMSKNTHKYHINYTNAFQNPPELIFRTTPFNLPCDDVKQLWIYQRFTLLQVSDRKDPNWWQASHVENSDVVGLIPSPELEERRKAYVPPEADFVHKISICGARVSTSIINPLCYILS